MLLSELFVNPLILSSMASADYLNLSPMKIETKSMHPIISQHSYLLVFSQESQPVNEKIRKISSFITITPNHNLAVFYET